MNLSDIEANVRDSFEGTIIDSKMSVINKENIINRILFQYDYKLC